MGKVITSPVKRFPGTVTLPDGYTFPQIIAFDKSLADARGDGQTNTEMWFTMLRGLIPCVESWNLTGVPSAPTPETFPATPRGAATRLVSWLFEEIAKHQSDDDADPNA